MKKSIIWVISLIGMTTLFMLATSAQAQTARVRYNAKRTPTHLRHQASQTSSKSPHVLKVRRKKGGPRHEDHTAQPHGQFNEHYKRPCQPRSSRTHRTKMNNPAT
ncbi:hypothetical protein [Pontibacter sp. G13]|uniref:hypothetical protein n=1 Tax=Pontibacter sp. G13 TaxID=3074898 RepID=UPI00288B6DA4|nr:hypothetical protein [Pontibacter sp. G13]WNJ20941.1 hypothetical protein RJD25_10725 [Pontibacter sp. G13]